MLVYVGIKAKILAIHEVQRVDQRMKTDHWDEIRSRMHDYADLGLPEPLEMDDIQAWIDSPKAVDVYAWPELDLRRHAGHGVYCVMLAFNAQIPHYIGKTTNVLKRMADHSFDHVQGQPYRPVRWLGIPEHANLQLMRRLEAQLIRKYQPGGNTIGVRHARN